VPLLPVVEALRRVSEQIGWGEWLRLVGDARPELAACSRAGSAGGDADRALAQSRLFELLLGLLRRLADRKPMVWIVEDVHWPDASTLDLLSFVLRNLRDERALIVVTFRDDETERNERLRAWLPGSAVPVGSSGSTSALRADRPTCAAHRRPGRPCRSARWPSGCSRAPTATRSSPRSCWLPPSTTTRSPATLRDVFVGQLARLDPPSQHVVRAAAAIGRRVDHQLLATVAELPEDRLLPALRQAVRHRLLVPEPDGRTYGFRHALMREAASSELLPGEREQLHARIAEALAEAPGAGGGYGGDGRRRDRAPLARGR
jgi:hypothetical protein